MEEGIAHESAHNTWKFLYTERMFLVAVGFSIMCTLSLVRESQIVSLIEGTYKALMHICICVP